MNLKIKCLRDKLAVQNIQGMIITNPTSIKYLTNIDAEGTLLLTRKENVYITDGRYIEHVNSVLTIDDDIIVTDCRDIIKDDYENFFMFCENVGFEEKHVTYEQYNGMLQLYKCNNLVETEGIIEKQRTIKDMDEISYVEKACNITDDCFKHLLTFIKIGDTEKEIAAEILKYFLMSEADGLAFDPIVATGPNSSKPHHIPTNRKIIAGDTILIDMGCKYKGYCSDMTRTIFMKFVPEYIKPVYDLVLKNNLLTIKEAKENREIKLLSRMVENDFSIHKYTQIHALGHGVGLDEHEYPFITMKSSSNLKENMVVAIEPGIYEPNKFGVRIEDTTYITKNGCIVLTNSEKNYIVLKNKSYTK